MFKGEKTTVFWIGLILLALASVTLFGIFWIANVLIEYSESRMSFLKAMVPLIVGGIVFILIGLYMMKSGFKKKPQN